MRKCWVLMLMLVRARINTDTHHQHTHLPYLYHQDYELLIYVCLFVVRARLLLVTLTHINSHLRPRTHTTYFLMAPLTLLTVLRVSHQEGSKCWCWRSERVLLLVGVRVVVLWVLLSVARAKPRTLTLTLTPSSRNKVVVGELVSN